MWSWKGFAGFGCKNKQGSIYQRNWVTIHFSDLFLIEKKIRIQLICRFAVRLYSISKIVLRAAFFII
jgi:hypothetical protein